MGYTKMFSGFSYDFLNKISNIQKIFLIEKEVTEIYNSYFGLNPKYFRLVNKFGNFSPMTVRQNSIIYVNCPSFNEYQFAFQFTRELCHWMIPGDVANNLRWLEESIAMAASWFFYPKVSFSDPDIASSYIEQLKSEQEPINTSELFKENSDLLNSLETNAKNYTDYPKYTSISLSLYPAIYENPLFWKSVPSLCQIPPGLDFQDSLDIWKRLLPSGPILDVFSYVISSLK